MTPSSRVHSSLEAMRVGLNLSGLRAQSFGGAQRYAIELATSLGQAGVQTTAIVTSDPSDQLLNLESEGLISIQRLGHGEYSEARRILLERGAVGGIASRLNLDILHSLSAYGVPVSGRVKQVVSVFDTLDRAYPAYFSFGQRMKRKIAFQLGDRHVSRYLAISEFTKREYVLRARVAEDRISVAPLAPPVTSGGVGGSAHDECEFPWHGHRYAIYPATFTPHKQHMMLLNAWRAVVDACQPAPHLVLSGHGTIDPRLESRIQELGLHDEVHLAGLLPEPDLECALRGATCVVFPSRYEGFGLPLVEAMQLGVPVVASGLASIPEVVGDAGILVKEQSPSAYASAAISVFNDAGLRHKLIRRGVDRSAHFSWRRTAAATIACYQLALQ